jgi:hypothetical protein
MMRIAARLWFWAAILRPVKHVLPLARLVRLVHRAPGARRNDTRVQQVEDALQRLGRAPRRPPANCLERSLGAYRMLCEAGAAPQIVVGMRRGAGTRVEGHVWVVVEGRALAEDDAFIATFSRVLAFDADGRQVSGARGGMPPGVRLS